MKKIILIAAFLPLTVISMAQENILQSRKLSLMQQLQSP